MPEGLTLLEILLLTLAVLGGSTAVSSLGFGVGMVATPILLLAFEPQAAIVTLAPAATLISALTAWKQRHHIPFKTISPILLLGVLGSLTGVYILSTSDEQLLRITIVILIILLTFITVLDPSLIKDKIPYPKIVGPIIGYVVGFMLGSMAIGGPLIVLFWIMRGWNSNEIRGMAALFLLCIIGTGTIGYIPANLYTGERLTISLIAIVPVFAGYFLGTRIAGLMNEKVFRKAAVGLIVTSSLLVLQREFI